MKPSTEFTNLPKTFWATVRTLGQEVGYTERGQGQIKIPTLHEMTSAFRGLGLLDTALQVNAKPTALAKHLLAYFQYRAKVLNDEVEPNLMNAEEAEALYTKLRSKLAPRCPIPMNKQKGEMKKANYLTAIVNMIVEHYSNGQPCDYDPRKLTTVTQNGIPLRTLARRVDGAFPSHVNPIAIWEIKEYYYTTTFGSRVADGVYETLLDGMEVEDLREKEGIDILHYLMVDAHYTWWDCGRSYLCRIIDMLHMGYVDEVLFGREIVTRLPAIVIDWVQRLEMGKD
jgi:hypothetical protein